MTRPPLALNVLAAAVLAALAFAARADAGPGHQPAPGHALHPAPVNPTTEGRGFHADGMGTREPAARSPIGRLYDMPVDAGEAPEAKAPGGWILNGFVEAGLLGVRGNERAQGFAYYKDLKDGPYLNVFALTGEQAARALFFEATGGAMGRDDQHYRLQAGRHNDWSIAAFYDGIPTLLTSRYRSLWHGAGTAELQLAGLRPGGTTNAATTEANIRAALAATPQSELSILRKKAGVRVDKKLGEAWNVYASFTDERREGARPFAAVFGGGGGGGNMEISETIDYSTRDLVAGLQYADPLNSLNLRAAASFFANEVDTLGFQNPVYINLNGTTGLAPTLFTHGRFAPAPDNQHYNVKAEYGRALPGFYRGNFTAAVALGWMRQDDDLLTPTEYPLSGGTVTAGGAALANMWNTPGALSRKSADASLDTRLVDLGLVLKPASTVDVRAKLRYYETRNSSQYVSCNPLTGQWGRLINEGSGLSLVTAHTGTGVNRPGTSANAYNGAGCDLDAVRALNLVPSAGNIPIATIPNDYQQLNALLGGDYRVGRASSVNASFERESFRRDYREREETWEDKLKVGYVNRGLLEGTVRVGYEHARRGGSEYHPGPYFPFRSAAMGPLPAANNASMTSWVQVAEQFRSFDLADRTQDTLHGRVDYGFAPGLDAAFGLRLRDTDYAAQYGRTGHQKSGNATFDLTWQAGPQTVLYGFYNYQESRMAQRGVQSNNCQLAYTYYFYSNGVVLAAASSAAPPATPAGTTLVATQAVTAANWQSVCSAASPTSPLFPESRAWDVNSRDRNHVFGAGLKYDFGGARVDGTFTRSLGRTRTRYGYNAAALGLTPTQAALTGEGLPDITFAQNVFDFSVLVPVSPTFTMRVLLRYESGKVRDWHYDGLADNPMPANNAVYLDGGPQDYRNTMLGLFFQLRM